MDVSGEGRVLHFLFAGGYAPVAYVVADGVVEENRVLRNHADVGVKRRLSHLDRGRGAGRGEGDGGQSHTVSESRDWEQIEAGRH